MLKRVIIGTLKNNDILIIIISTAIFEIKFTYNKQSFNIQSAIIACYTASSDMEGCAECSTIEICTKASDGYSLN